MSKCVCVGVCVHVGSCPLRPEEGIGLLKNGVTGIVNWHAGARKETHILRKNSKGS